MLNQKLQQKLLQKLSPQQIQLMKLLQVPTIALEQRIKQEIEENPALEEGTMEDVEGNQDDEFDNEYEEDNTGSGDQDDDFNLSDYMDDDEIPSYKLNAKNQGPDDDHKTIPFEQGQSFHDNLISQLGLRINNEKDYRIGMHIIGNIDDSGYIQRDLDAMVDDLAFSQNISTSKAEIIRVLKTIQDFEPAGIGARDLQECLSIQLKRKDDSKPDIKRAKDIINTCFKDFTKKHYEKIMKKLDLTEEQLKNALDIILMLNPKPGNSMSESTRTAFYIVPDFLVTNENGELDLTLNSKNAPDLRISKSYMEMIKAYANDKGKKDKRKSEEVSFIRQKIDSAKWFIDAIKQRQHTLLATMQAIIDYQKEYFLTGDEKKLRPMILKDIAEKVNLDISTISRVANSKYVQTNFGTFLLKSFFSESIQTNEGEEVSTREVKKILIECIEKEDKKKPVTDEQLATILKEKGYNIARRTVAKYREQLNIPVARLRKEL